MLISQQSKYINTLVPDELAESVYAKLDDVNKFEDVTEKVNLSYTSNGGYTLNL